MILYSENNNLAFALGYYFRRDKKTGYYLSTKAIGGKRKRLHRFIWEYYNSEIPAGYDIHHKNHNKEDNEIENLELILSKDHQKLHGKELTDEQRRKKAENVVCKANPQAREWHRSEKGREWHKQHYESMKSELHTVKEYTCQQCGKTYKAVENGQNRFCCNNCKAAYRRQAGIDNVERECEICGQKFITNKYSKAKYCKAHRGKKRKT